MKAEALIKKVIPSPAKRLIKRWLPRSSRIQSVASAPNLSGAGTSFSIEQYCAILSHIRELAQQGQRVAFDQALWSHAEVIRHYLHNFVLDNAGTDYIVPYVNDALPRFFHTLGLLPLRSGLRVLELGANPYLFSMLVRRFLDYETTYANFFGKSIYDTSVGTGSQRAWSSVYGESYTFNYATFNLELSEYPYPDDSFELVLFCEILEHLAIDPLKVFQRLRRIICPGGFLLLTTPNAVRLANVALMLTGSNFFDRYHPEFTVYGRHNREFTVEELQVILTGNGFNVLDITTRDRYNYSEPIIWKDNYEAPARLPYTRPQIEGWLTQIGASLDHRGDNIYVLAQRQAE